MRTAATLREKIRKALARSGARKTSPSFDLVGCDRERLIAHIEAQFSEGMSWRNYGAWHIDHIRPVCTFDLTNPDQQRAAFNFRNLRPLWAHENLARPRRNWRPDIS